MASFSIKKISSNLRPLRMASNWNANGKSQIDLMTQEQCIVVNNEDSIIQYNTKETSHTFSKENPRGLLHRAFSVFLFDSEGRLLLQQRASNKITFPDVWTNTCCSHPLHGTTPNEVDTDDDISKGSVPGVKSAAIRKLKHELGIDSPSLTTNEFKYLTRLHYWAADVITHGPQSSWGEHEIDYILFAQVNVPLTPNPAEVRDTRYVTLPELQAMMSPTSGLLWSPWFRIIADKFLPQWWADLNQTLHSDRHVDLSTIHRFDPTSEHMGGAGGAFEWLGNCDGPFPVKGVSKFDCITSLPASSVTNSTCDSNSDRSASDDGESFEDGERSNEPLTSRCHDTQLSSLLSPSSKAAHVHPSSECRTISSRLWYRLNSFAKRFTMLFWAPLGLLVYSLLYFLGPHLIGETSWNVLPDLDNPNVVHGAHSLIYAIFLIFASTLYSFSLKTVYQAIHFAKSISFPKLGHLPNGN